MHTEFAYSRLMQVVLAVMAAGSAFVSLYFIASFIVQLYGETINFKQKCIFVFLIDGMLPQRLLARLPLYVQEKVFANFRITTILALRFVVNLVWDMHQSVNNDLARRAAHMDALARRMRMGVEDCTLALAQRMSEDFTLVSILANREEMPSTRLFPGNWTCAQTREPLYGQCGLVPRGFLCAG